MNSFVLVLLCSLILIPLFFSVSAWFSSFGKKEFRFAVILNVLVLIALVYFRACCSDQVTGAYQIQWFKELGVSFSVFLPLYSLLSLLFTTFIYHIFVSYHQKLSSKEYSCLLLILASLNGIFISHNLLMFYVFYELMLFPVFYLVLSSSRYALNESTINKNTIGVAKEQGSSIVEDKVDDNRSNIALDFKETSSSAFTFLLYTLAGSLCLLFSIAYLAYAHYQQFGTYSLELSSLALLDLSLEEQSYLFLACLLAFGIKAPIFPLHSWLPKVYSSVGKGTSIIIASLLFQAGIYGLYRIAYFLFPDAARELSGLVACLAVSGIVYTALVAWRTKTIRGMLAFASVSHVGFSILGLAIWQYSSIVGGLYQVFAHVVIACGLFLIADILERRGGSERIEDYSGLASYCPRLGFFLVFFSLSAVSIPLTAGFVGEFMVLASSFSVFPVLTIVCFIAVIFGAVYFLNLIAQVLYGAPKGSDSRVQSDVREYSDLNSSEFSICILIALVILILGITPSFVIDSVGEDVQGQFLMMGEGGR